MTKTPHLTRLSLLAFALSALQGCFFIVDDHEHDQPSPEPPPPANFAPEILPAETWWLCDYDPVSNDWFFEVQAVVEDWDGVRDVEGVQVDVFAAETWDQLDSFALFYEGDGIWGGVVWESSSGMICGEPLDFEYLAWDFYGDTDALLLTYF